MRVLLFWIFLLAQGPQGGYVLKKIAIQLWWILIIL